MRLLMQSIKTIADKVGINLVNQHVKSGVCHDGALTLLDRLCSKASPSHLMRNCKMMTAKSNKWKGFSYIPEEVIKKSDRYIFHRDDGEKVSDKVITCDELTCWCQKEFSTLAADAEEELLHGHTVVTEEAIFSLDVVNENFEPQKTES